MMRLARRATLLVAFSVLASTATAYAECAWVLWERISFPNTLDWRILQTYDVRAQCSADHAKLMSPNSAWRAGYEPLGEDSVIQRLSTGVIVKRALCVPGTIDPRAPAEK
jgi:hypothetical protein